MWLLCVIPTVDQIDNYLNKNLIDFTFVLWKWSVVWLTYDEKLIKGETGLEMIELWKKCHQ